jgi:hypothetical protein
VQQRHQCGPVGGSVHSVDGSGPQQYCQVSEVQYRSVVWCGLVQCGTVWCSTNGTCGQT